MRSTIVLFFLLLTVHYCFAQTSFNLSGTVKDKRGEVLPGAGIFVSGYKIATVADNNGKYTLPLKPGNYDILFQLIGYK
ncbi:MAG: carboxypeptidase-like regulatory domain-containing protein, partial [Pedobacter sp.]